ncbi:MAG: hypothetical protein HGA47_13950, partial [Zoogloea sp.]|nr:hypothetical protein [Zoogloea sp.]
CDRLYPELFAGALAPLRVILELGPLARRIVRVLDDPVQWSQLRAVYRDLAECLEHGCLFLGKD